MIEQKREDKMIVQSIGANLMDYFKKGTCKDYTEWDLNCPHFVRPDNDLRRKFKRKFRRKEKKALDKLLNECYNEYRN